MVPSVCKGDNHVTSADEVQDLSQFSFSFLSEWPRIARTWLSERELATIMFKSSEDDFRALVGGRCSRRV
jgi:hypothetical protein